MVADIEIDGATLFVHIRGSDKFWALATKLEVPLAHIAGVDIDVSDAHSAWHGLRMGGTNLPGVITAGRFVQHGQLTFWDVHDPSEAIAIRLHDEPPGYRGRGPAGERRGDQLGPGSELRPKVYSNA